MFVAIFITIFLTILMILDLPTNKYELKQLPEDFSLRRKKLKEWNKASKIDAFLFG